MCNSHMFTQASPKTSTKTCPSTTYIGTTTYFQSYYGVLSCFVKKLPRGMHEEIVEFIGY
jgi:hypothetical protein